MRKEVFVFMLLLSLSSFMFIACDDALDTSIADINDDPAYYSGKEVLVIGVFSRSIDVVGGASNHFNEYISDFQGNKLKVVCSDADFTHNQKYGINGTIVYDNTTQEHYILCSHLPVER